MTTPPPDNMPAADDPDDALHCPSCRYSLHGVCTPAKPVGKCPECGLAFRRERLLKLQQDGGTAGGTWIALELISFPIALAMLQGCLGCAGLIEMQSGNYFFTPVDLLVTPWIAVPVLGAVLLAGMVATHAVPGLPPTVSPQRRKQHRADFYEKWALFAVLEVMLTATYLFIGCGAFI